MNTKITISNFRKHSSNRWISLRKPSISIAWTPSFVLIQVIRVSSVWSKGGNYLCALDRGLYQAALAKFRSMHQERFHARLDWSAAAEIVAIIFTSIAHVFSIILAIARVDWLLVRLFFVATMHSLRLRKIINTRSLGPENSCFDPRVVCDFCLILLVDCFFIWCLYYAWLVFEENKHCQLWFVWDDSRRREREKTRFSLLFLFIHSLVCLSGCVFLCSTIGALIRYLVSFTRSLSSSCHSPPHAVDVLYLYTNIKNDLSSRSPPCRVQWSFAHRCIDYFLCLFLCHELDRSRT